MSHITSPLALHRTLTGSVFVLACILILAMTGCLAGEDTDSEEGNSNVFSFSTEGDVLTHTAPQGATPGLLVVETNVYTCWDDTAEVLPNPVSSVERDSSRYAISGGTLYLWYQHDCWASTYSGTSTSIFGKWTSNSFKEVKIPAAYRTEACLEEYEICELEDTCVDSYPEDDAYENLNNVTTINPTQVWSSLSGRFCMARNFAQNIMRDNLASGLDSVSMGCGVAKIRNTEQNTVATISSTSDNSMFSVKFQFDTTICSLTTEFGPVTQNSQCSEIADGPDLSAFYSCIFTSGFFEGIGSSVDEEGFSLGKQSTERAQTAPEILKGRSLFPR